MAAEPSSNDANVTTRKRKRQEEQDGYHQPSSPQPPSRKRRGRKSNAERAAIAAAAAAAAAAASTTNPYPTTTGPKTRARKLQPPGASRPSTSARSLAPVDSLEGSIELSQHVVLSRELKKRLEDCAHKWQASISAFQSTKEFLDGWMVTWTSRGD